MKTLIKFAVVGLALIPLSSQPQTLTQKVEFCNAFAETVAASARLRDARVNKNIAKQLLRQYIDHEELVRAFDGIIDQVYDSRTSPEQLQNAYQMECYKLVFTQ